MVVWVPSGFLTIVGSLVTTTVCVCGFWGWGSVTICTTKPPDSLCGVIVGLVWVTRVCFWLVLGVMTCWVPVKGWVTMAGLRPTQVEVKPASIFWAMFTLLVLCPLEPLPFSLAV